MEQSGILFHRPNKNQIVVEHLWSEPPEFSALPRKKKLGKLFSMLQGGGPGGKNIVANNSSLDSEYEKTRKIRIHFQKFETALA